LAARPQFHHARTSSAQASGGARFKPANSTEQSTFKAFALA
jgi:hypothetical protein